MAQKLKKKTKQKQVIIKKPQRSIAKEKSKTAMTFPKSGYVEAVGRRKTAIARVRIYEEAGDFGVNDKPIGEYFKGINNSPKLYNQPLHVTESLGNWAISAKVSGSGIRAQLDAVVHGIARALVKKDETKFHPLLKSAGLLTRDSRMKETRKIGMGGKARRQRQSPKR
jgi:small subunit ribosomal protein S9